LLPAFAKTFQGERRKKLANSSSCSKGQPALIACAIEKAARGAGFPGEKRREKKKNHGSSCSLEKRSLERWLVKEEKALGSLRSASQAKEEEKKRASCANKPETRNS